MRVLCGARKNENRKSQTAGLSEVYASSLVGSPRDSELIEACPMRKSLRKMCTGMVRKSAIILFVGQYTILILLPFMRSLTKKYRTLMCFDLWLRIAVRGFVL